MNEKKYYIYPVLNVLTISENEDDVKDKSHLIVYIYNEDELKFFERLKSIRAFNFYLNCKRYFKTETVIK